MVNAEPSETVQLIFIALGFIGLLAAVVAWILLGDDESPEPKSETKERNVRRPPLPPPQLEDPFAIPFLAPSGSHQQVAPTVAKESQPTKQETKTELLADCIASRCSLVLLTGKAGTGKSYLAKQLARNVPIPTAIVAPTGIAALNAGGLTINSFFRAPWTPIPPDRSILANRNNAVIRKLELLIVDEVSMVRPDLLHYVDRSLRKVRKNDSAFGGLPVLLVGDPFQLPPVVPSGDEAHFLDTTFGGTFFFNTPAVQDTPMKAVELTTVYRQTEPDFISALDSIREGTNLRQALQLLNTRVGRPEESTIILCITRARVDEINDARLLELPKPEWSYRARIEGEVGKDDLKYYQSPALLKLRLGTRVMFTQNDPGHRWVNGTLGTVRRMKKSGVEVETDSGLNEVEPATWMVQRPTWDARSKTIKVKQVGTFVQLPLMHAWATTVHKAQGLTLDRAHLDLDSAGWCHGLVYTAVSRTKELAGLTLARPLQHGDVQVSRALQSWYNEHVRQTDSGWF